MNRVTQMSWRQAGVAALAAVLLVLAAGCFQLSVGDVRLLVFDAHYADAELEIVRYDLEVSPPGFGPPNARRGKGNRPAGPSRIEGVVHPGGIPVATNDRDVSLAHFDRSGPVVDLPLPAEVEGRRIPVLFWAGDPAGRRWYHPPVVLTAVRPSPAGTILSVLLCAGLLFGSGWCVRYVYDRRRAALHHAAERRPGRWPPWTFLVLMGCVITYPLLGLIVLARTTGFTRTPAGRIPWTAADWAMSAVFIAAVAVAPVLLTAAVVYAVRHRLAFRARLAETSTPSGEKKA